jgi:hypothetical protein
MATSRMQTASRSKNPTVDIAVTVTRLKAALEAAVDELQRLTLDAGTDNSPASGKVAPKAAPDGATAQIAIWEDDPFLSTADGSQPVAAQTIKVDVPENTQPLLQTEIVGPTPEPGLFEPLSSEFRYWNADSALTRGINFWGPLLPAGTKWTTAQQPLAVQLDEAVDFNAFYARDNGLNFFHGVVDKVNPQVTAYSAESPDVVCHELGHAILDAVKPELFDAMSVEVAAFHEAFGDISSTLSGLQLESFRQFVLNQTGGQLNLNSRLSQLARQLGWAIRVEFGPTEADNDCLRNTSNSFFYQDPNGLPPTGPANQLTSEPHSFSRVFSGAFLDVLAGMFRIGPAGSPASDSAKLLTISFDAGKLLIEGVRLASVGPGFYAQAAAGMVQADQTLNGGRYRTALTSSFVQRGILSPAAAVSLVRDLQAHGGQVFGVTGLTAGGIRQLQFEGDNEGYKTTANDAPALPLRPLTTRFGVTIHVHMAADPSRFGVAGASVAGGSEKMLSAEEDASFFVEDLVQLDEISHDNASGVMPAELTAPRGMDAGYKTHRLVNAQGKTVLKRHHFTCGFPACKHGR